MCEIMEMLQNLPFPIETILGGGGVRGEGRGGQKPRMIYTMYNILYNIFFATLPIGIPKHAHMAKLFLPNTTSQKI